MKKVAFHTLGCKLNFSETSAISRMFADKGFVKVDFPSPADVYVINTCSVTENADKECRRIVRSALSASPDACIVVIGCYAQLKPEEIAGVEGVDLVLGASEKFKILNYLDDLSKRAHSEIHSCEIADVNEFRGAYSLGDRTRAFLKVQDGCDYTCSYCTIPLARGASRSGTIAHVVGNAREIAASGVKEIVLTGVNIGDFGNSKGEDFLQLIRALDQVSGIARFRISSIEPNLLSNEIIGFVAASERFVPHFHIPLQSGSDRILKLMRRRYLRDLYAERVSAIKALMPHCCIGVDVIAGFPGETEEDFMETYHFLHELDISYLHVFTYSERANTDALKIKEAVPVSLRRQRNKMLRTLSAKKLRHFYGLHSGTQRTVLFEGENDRGFMYGFTDNYIKVKTKYDPALVNRLRTVQLSAIDSDGIATLQDLSQEESLITIN
ncbi:MAG: tRNA (N(6)-L-threonylcarbamoyladenosine(37)-C(2))-methylthiotransferase MtaB [Bacteroidota bacterium]